MEIVGSVSSEKAARNTALIVDKNNSNERQCHRSAVTMIADTGGSGNNMVTVTTAKMATMAVMAKEREVAITKECSDSSTTTSAMRDNNNIGSRKQ